MAGFTSSSDSILDRVLTNVEQRIHQGRLIDRMWTASDALWQAGGRLRAVAREDELAAVNEVERIIRRWKVGEPIPNAWTAAISQFRLRLEELGAVAPCGPGSSYEGHSPRDTRSTAP